MNDGKTRCDWALHSQAETIYHDTEWGVPVHDDRLLYAKLVLDGAQAGLSWSTILNKRDNYFKAFDDFDFTKVARYSEKKIERLLQNPGIVRNRLKITSAIKNANAVIAIRDEYGSFSEYLWDFVSGTPIVNAPKTMAEIPANTPLSDTISKDLKKRGMSFVGSTIVYAYMQAVGLVNDHLVTCFRYNEIISTYS